MSAQKQLSDLSLPTLSKAPGRGADELIATYRQMIIASDFAAGALAAVLSMIVRFGGLTPLYEVLTAAYPVLWVAMIAGQRGYERRFLGTGPGEYRRLSDATLMLFAIGSTVAFMTRTPLSRGYFLLALPLALGLSCAGRHYLRTWLYKRRLSGEGMQRVLVVGRADAARHLIEQLDREPWHGLLAVDACLAADVVDVREAASDRGLPIPRPRRGEPFEWDPDAVIARVKELHIDVVAVASNPDLSGPALRRLAWALEEDGVELIVSPGIVEVAGPRLSIRPVAGLSLLHLERPATRGGRVLAKSMLDRVLGALLLLLATPVFVLVALVIRSTSPGPVLFRQTRVGVRGKPFQMLKFRSMVPDAEAQRDQLEQHNEDDGVRFKMRNDPRITRVGAWLRRCSIDELPQLWNVVRGDMSLVGPRPPLPEEVARYDSDAIRRLRVKPGLTGLWQVSGRSDLSWEESLRLDLRYVDNWSFVMDVTILWRTARAVLSRSGAY